MTLVELRKLAIRKQSKIRFTLRNGMECVISEDGIARVPDLKAVPEFNLEQELASATIFQLEIVSSDPKTPVRSRSVAREELATLTSAGATVEVHDHEDE